MTNVRKTGNRAEFDAVWREMNKVIADVAGHRLGVTLGALSYADIGAGTINGTLRTNNAVDYVPDGFMSRKAATDNLWDLSGETATAASGAGSRAAFLLCLDGTGDPSFVRVDAETDEAVQTAGLAAARAVDDKAVIGAAFFGPSTDFTAALSPGMVAHFAAPPQAALQSATVTPVAP